MAYEVINLQDRLKAKAAITGDLLFVICPICKDKDSSFFPVIGITGRDKRAFIAHLMCVSEKCKGNTILDVDNGFISEDVRILDDI